MKRIGQVYREALATKIKDGIENNKNVFLLSYSKMSGKKLNDIRKELQGAGAAMHVSRNNISRLALKELKHDPLAESIAGQTAFVWTNNDSVEISKVLVKFAKEFEQVAIKGALVEKALLDGSDVARLSELPSREVLLSQLLATIQAPVSRLLSAFNAKSQDLLSILKQLSEKKGGE